MSYISYFIYDYFRTKIVRKVKKENESPINQR